MQFEGILSERPAKAIYGLIALIILFILAQIIVLRAMTAVPEFELVGNQPTLIDQVPPGSAAEAAGVKAGDILRKIDGAPFDRSSLISFAGSHQVGQIIQLTIEREGLPQVIHVPLVPAFQVIRKWVFYFGGLVLVEWAVSVVLLWRFFEKNGARIFYLLSQAAWIGYVMPAMQFTIWEPLTTWQILISGFAGLACAPFLFHLFLTYPVKFGTPARRVFALTATYALGIDSEILWIYSVTGWGPIWNGWIALAITGLIFLAAYLFLILSYIRLTTHAQRRQMRWSLIGSLFTIWPSLFLFGLPIILNGTPILPTGFAGAFLLAGLTIYAYLILGLNLTTPDIVLNRVVVMLILFAGVLAILVGPVLYLDMVLPNDWALHATVLAGLILLVAFSFNQIQNKVRQLVDGLFYGDWYDFPKVVQTVSAALARSLEWKQLEDILTRQVPHLMRLSWAQLSTDAEDKPDTTTWPAPIRVPLRFEGHTYAFWTVGPSLDGNDYSFSDRRIISTLAPQVEVALSNILRIQQLHQQLEDIRTSHETLTRMGYQLIRSRDEEQARLSRELHDGPLQDLVGMNMQLGILISKLESEQGSSNFQETLANLRSEVRGVMTELRQVCAGLRPPLIDTLGLAAALRALADDWSLQQGFAVTTDLPADERTGFLNSDVSMNLYRVAQEALSNIARHAEAQRVWLSLEYREPEGLCLTIQDDGKGFDLEGINNLAQQNHFGIVGMKERAASIGAEWAIESRPGGGTTIQVTWDKGGWIRSFPKTPVEMPGGLKK